MVDSEPSLGPSGGIRIRQCIESHRFQLLLRPPLWELQPPRIAWGFLQTLPARLGALGEHTLFLNWDYSSANHPPFHSPRSPLPTFGMAALIQPSIRSLLCCVQQRFPGSASAKLPFCSPKRSAPAASRNKKVGKCGTVFFCCPYCLGKTDLGVTQERSSLDSA